MYNLYSLLFNIHMKVQSTIKSTQYIRKYINVLLDVLCTFFPFPLDKYLFLRVNVPLGVLCTFKSESTKYIQRHKVHPKVKKYTTHVCFNLFLRIGLKQKRKVHPINCDVLETIILTSAKISSGRAGLPSSKPLLLTHFCMSVSISARVHMFPKVLKSVLTVPMNIR